jgi:thiamine-phosphate pyrophosphorylase
MELIVISNPGIIANEAQIINRLFEAGMKRFHLRKPDWEGDRIIDLINGIDQVYHPYIALHQHHNLTDSFNINRLHYTERQRIITDKETLNYQTQKGYVLSTSIHNLTEIASIKDVEYVLFGPVFNSISKPGYKSQLQEGFRLEKTEIQTKVIALGGIEVSNLNKVKAMNFDGAAVLGTLWDNPDNAVSSFKKLKHCLINYEQND